MEVKIGSFPTNQAIKLSARSCDVRVRENSPLPRGRRAYWKNGHIKEKSP